MPFKYEAKPSAQGNQQVRRRCVNAKCGGTLYVGYKADNFKCPHCGWPQPAA